MAQRMVGLPSSRLRCSWSEVEEERQLDELLEQAETASTMTDDQALGVQLKLVNDLIQNINRKLAVRSVSDEDLFALEALLEELQ